MTLTHKSNGVTISQTEWNDVVDAINNLVAAAITIGGTVGSQTVNSTIGGAEVTDTLSAGGGVTVTHGLGWTPQVVFTQMRGNPNVAGTGPYTTYVSNITSTQFTVYFGTPTGIPSPDWNPGAGGQSVTFDWLAFKAI